MTDYEEYLSAREVQAMTGIATGTLANWRSAQVGPNYLKVRGRVLYRLSDVESFLNSGLVETVDQHNRPGKGKQ